MPLFISKSSSQHAESPAVNKTQHVCHDMGRNTPEQGSCGRVAEGSSNMWVLPRSKGCYLSPGGLHCLLGAIRSISVISRLLCMRMHPQLVYGGPSSLSATYDGARGQGSFGILPYGSCGYTNGDGSLAFPKVRASSIWVPGKWLSLVSSTGRGDLDQID